MDYDYTDEGQLESLSRGTKVFWQVEARNAAGQLTGESFGNVVSTARAYDPETGFLTGIQSGFSTATDRQNESYTWDDIGNATEREDDLQSLSETFEYDDLHRLTGSTVSGQTPRTYEYDAIGNLKKKSDVSATAYTYGTRTTGCGVDPGPHAVSVAGGQPFCYDANGNQTKGYNFRTDTARTYAWTTYNKPSQITEGTATVQFWNGADRRHFKQVNSSTGAITWARSCWSRTRTATWRASAIRLTHSDGAGTGRTGPTR